MIIQKNKNLPWFVFGKGTSVLELIYAMQGSLRVLTTLPCRISLLKVLLGALKACLTHFTSFDIVHRHKFKVAHLVMPLPHDVFIFN